jgi:hypothetical protein
VTGILAGLLKKVLLNKMMGGASGSSGGVQQEQQDPLMNLYVQATGGATPGATNTSEQEIMDIVRKIRLMNGNQTMNSWGQ